LRACYDSGVTEARAPLAALNRERISILGKDLRSSLLAVADALVPGAAGSGALAAASGMSAAFASRLLKALRQTDATAVVFHLPGPAPLRRFVDAALAAGVPAPLGVAAHRAVAQLERCIREEAGDRSALHAVIAAWQPDHAAEFALARKQEIFRAWSQLKGAAAELNVATVILHPSATAGRLDVLWIMGLLGLRRLRPGATVKLATRRLTAGGEVARAPDPLALGEFCHAPPAALEAHAVGETVHYLLGDSEVGLSGAADLLLAEANRAEIAYGRARGDAARRTHVFAEVGTPSRTLVFDLLVHEALFPGQEPELRLYDTILDGVADVNDPSRDVDLLDLPESVAALGRGLAPLRLDGMPRYQEMLARVCERAGWDPARLRAWRCRVEYPPHGAQVVLAFDAPVTR
jgi:hypothetical protein